MKKTVITLTAISVLLVSYCLFEFYYLKSFSTQVESLLSSIEQEERQENIEEKYEQLAEFLEQEKATLEQVTPRAEIELLFISLAHLEDYLVAGQLYEVKVAAGEMKCILSDIADSPII